MKKDRIFNKSRVFSLFLAPFCNLELQF